MELHTPSDCQKIARTSPELCEDHAAPQSDWNYSAETASKRKIRRT